jgi:preprotein translocase subunit SecF
LVVFSQQNGDIIKKDITLTGGTSIQIYSNTDINALKSTLTGKLVDFSIRQVSDLVTGDQLAVIIETRSSPEEAVPVIEDYLGYKLTSENSSIEFTGSTIGSGFYIQLMLAIILAFTFMGTVVFFIFSDKLKFKIILIILSLVAPTLFFFAKVITISQAFIISFLVIALIIYFSIKYSIPSFAVVLSAFADIIMTVAVVNLAGMEVSTAGIVAFLMLIGYSVDTDILLTTRVLKRRGESVNSKIYGSFLTGMTMTLTALAVVIVGFIITSTFSDVLKQIFTILAIGLFFDIVNTWVTNASMIKWYAESHKII